MFTVTTETIADKRIREVKGAIFNEQVISINIGERYNQWY